MKLTIYYITLQHDEADVSQRRAGDVQQQEAEQWELAMKRSRAEKVEQRQRPSSMSARRSSWQHSQQVISCHKSPRLLNHTQNKMTFQTQI